MSHRASPVVSVVEIGDWPDVLPVTPQEVRIVETMMAEVLDELLGPLP